MRQFSFLLSPCKFCLIDATTQPSLPLCLHPKRDTYPVKVGNLLNQIMCKKKKKKQVKQFSAWKRCFKPNQKFFFPLLLTLFGPHSNAALGNCPCSQKNPKNWHFLIDIQLHSHTCLNGPLSHIKVLYQNHSTGSI